MALLEWSEELSVGVPEMDAQHQKLIELVNRLDAAMTAGKPRDEVSTILGGLLQYTRTHFTAEESFMRRVGYPHLAEQQAEHAALLAQIGEFIEDFLAGANLIGVKLSSFLRGWISNHIRRSDKKYGAWAKDRAGV